MEEIDELYTKYGKLQIQAEIIQNQLLDTKKQIVNEINKPELKPDIVKEPKNK